METNAMLEVHIQMQARRTTSHMLLKKNLRKYILFSTDVCTRLVEEER